MINYYKILEIADFSDETIIKTAFRNLSKKYHPDVNSDPSAHDYFIQIKSAYEVLSTTVLKQNYDRELYNYLHSITTTTSQDVQLNYFTVNTDHFVPNHFITVSWNVSHASSVFITGLGWVDHQGSSSILVQDYGKELTISMKAYNSHGAIYEWKHTLKNTEYNPSSEAYHRMLNEGLEVKDKHFKQENQFNNYGRISAKTFVKRIIKCVCIGLLLIFSHRGKWFENDLLDIFILIAMFLYCTCQYVKRKNDLYGHYNTLVDLFTKDSNESFTIFGPKEGKKITLKAWFKNQNNYSKSAVVSLGFLFVCYLSLFILPKQERIEAPTYYDTYFVKEGRNGKRAIAVLYYPDFYVSFTPNSKVFENYKKDANFYVARLAIFNKPMYVKTKHFVNNKEEEYKYYVGINDSNNNLVIYLILLMLFHLWLFFTLDKEFNKFRNISLVFLSIFYLYCAFYIFK